MFVYIWKDPTGTPFYVGCTRSASRTNPRNSGNRNWLCRQKIDGIGCENIVVELRHVASVVEGRELEIKLIEEYGRINVGTGTLTNLRGGGDGLDPMSEEHKAKLSAALKGRKRTSEQIEKQRKRMRDPDVQAKIRGENNPSKRPEVRQKLKDKWAEPEFRKSMSEKRKGRQKHTEEHKENLRKKLLDPNNPMREYHKILNSDPDIRERRIAGIHAAKDKIREKLNDPAAKELRKARLKETVNSPEYKAKRRLLITPEYRAKISAAKRAYWEKKRLEKSIKLS
jgi:hypothetical protein